MQNKEVLEELRWKKYPVLDKGYVCLVDAMGDDAAVVQAARVSYGAGTKAVSDDATLIRYLMRHSHDTPSEMCEVKFLIHIPMDAWRQAIRHRTFSVNEISSRYSIVENEFKESCNEWRKQSTDNKQGSDGYVNENDALILTEEEKQFHKSAYQLYQRRIDKGVAKEQARKDLPLSTYTTAYWKVNLRNLFHFLDLRLRPDAQLEIRQYAEAMADITKKLFPFSYKAFEDYVLNSMKLTALDIKQIQFVFINLMSGWIDEWKDDCRERREYIEKAKKLGIMF